MEKSFILASHFQVIKTLKVFNNAKQTSVLSIDWISSITEKNVNFSYLGGTMGLYKKKFPMNPY